MADRPKSFLVLPRPLLRPAVLLGSAAALFAAIGLVAAFRVGVASAPWLIAAGALGAAGVASGRGEREMDVALRARLRETRALEARLEEQRRTVDALADGLDAALLITDARGTILYANPPALRLFGHDAPVGQNLLAATLSVDLEQLLLSAAETDEPHRAEINFTVPREWIGLASAWRDPTESRVFVSVYEITGLRRLERARKDFVANVSHELRTPMTIIRGYAETLLDEDPPSAETSRRMLPRIVSEVDRLSTVLQDLLTLSVSESGTARKEPCDLAEVVQSVVERLGPKAREKGLALVYNGPDEFPVQANVAQVGQVALNLVDNALNYTAKGSVHATLGRDGDRAVLRVQDTGMGIASEHVERVFERFYRVDKGRSRATGGTGLGLSIVRHIVEAHGGTVRLDSALNRGSTFTVELPIE